MTASRDDGLHRQTTHSVTASLTIPTYRLDPVGDDFGKENRDEDYVAPTTANIGSAAALLLQSQPPLTDDFDWSTGSDSAEMVTEYQKLKSDDEDDELTLSRLSQQSIQFASAISPGSHLADIQRPASATAGGIRKPPAYTLTTEPLPASRPSATAALRMPPAYVLPDYLPPLYPDHYLGTSLQVANLPSDDLEQSVLSNFHTLPSPLQYPPPAIIPDSPPGSLNNLMAGAQSGGISDDSSPAAEYLGSPAANYSDDSAHARSPQLLPQVAPGLRPAVEVFGRSSLLSDIRTIGWAPPHLTEVDPLDAMRPAVMNPHPVQFPYPPQQEEPDVPSEDEDYTESDDEGMKDYRVGGYHPVKIGEIYQKRYRIEAKLGWGHFSTVWLATDWHHNPPKYVAIKFQKSAPHYYEAAHDEIELLQAASAPRFAANQAPLDADGELYRLLGDRLPKGNGVIELQDFFVHTGPHGVHVCMVFEVMGPNLLTLIKHYNFQGVPLDLARQIAVHVLVGLDHLHRRCGIIHTDLKPENVLVSRPTLPLPKSAVEYLAEIRESGGNPMEDTASNATPVAGPTRANGSNNNTYGASYKKNQKKKQKKKNKKNKKKGQAAKRNTQVNVTQQSQVANQAEVSKRLDGASEDAESDSQCESPRAALQAEASPSSHKVTGQSGNEPSVHRGRVPHGELFLTCSELPNSVRLAPNGSEPILHRIRFPESNEPNEKTNCFDAVLVKPPYNHALYKGAHSHLFRIDGPAGPRELTWLPRNTYDKVARNEAPLPVPLSPVEARKHMEPAPPDPNDIPTDPKLFSTLRTVDGVIDLKPSDANLFESLEAEYKIVDLGNGCWTHRHFSCDIQTRQYRSPEVLMAAGYGTSADIWSFACLMFELVTGDYLFEPKGSEEYTRDEDHLALIIELLGPVPTSLLDRARDREVYFTSSSTLKNIRDLKYWGLEDVLIHRYHFKPAEASYVSDFLLPMLEIEPNKRATAAEMLKHPWLSLRGQATSILPSEECRASTEQREFAKRQHPDMAAGRVDSSQHASSLDSRPPGETPQPSDEDASSPSSSQSWRSQTADEFPLPASPGELLE
eukprot:Blabericola_migrator_1__163@NODE_1042_length_5622_cov_112_349955_g702_i1_p1_GENE_NODE_1042_length_5622_cov_112_349955_g702_i1NODE_1042_length_5622_cov_112_349955_g702_i1_p1_ORF_typecomplete_len1079_score155_02Pkinase/PF00069_25/7_9e19Pkinase/PF00069_25/1_3e19Pkinase_Tyr/PF07714_17/6_8e08Pkinase_Tyr/PF07714_17/6_6e06Kinaselike/PF14531_6/0_28Kinaselike/PF14531_6/0_33Pkinase_fungal/PF17667_1/0_0044RIO1/PF01163_22/0_041RIO1/PF01163_22/4_1e03Kdo/PF06293_14/0_1Tho2/PF11262_8/4Tho2/PF11262_8/2_1e02_NOD